MSDWNYLQPDELEKKSIPKSMEWEILVLGEKKWRRSFWRDDGPSFDSPDSIYRYRPKQPQKPVTFEDWWQKHPLIFSNRNCDYEIRRVFNDRVIKDTARGIWNTALQSKEGK